MFFGRNILLKFWFLGVVLLGACTNRNMERSGSTDPVPDSAVVLRKALMVHDSALKQHTVFANALDADTTLRISLSQTIEFLPADKHEPLSALYARIFPESAQNSGFSDLWKGEYAIRKAQFKNAESHFKKAISQMRLTGDSVSLGHALNWLGATYSYTGRFVEATETHFQAMRVYRALGDSIGMYSTKREIAGAMSNQQQFDKAERVFLECLHFYQKAKLEIEEGSIHISLVGVYHNLGKNEKAIYHNNEALRLFQRNNYYDGIAQSLNNMAISLMSDGEFDEAKVWLIRAKAFADSTGDSLQMPILLYNMGVCEMELRNYDKAESLFQTSLNINDQSEMRGEITLRTLDRLSKVYEKTQRFAEALSYSRKHVAIKDSIFSTENARAIEELTLQYEAQQRESQLLEIKSKEKQKEIWIWFLSVLLIIIISALVIVFFALKARNARVREKERLEKELKQSEMLKIQQELEFHKQQLNDYVETLRDKSMQLVSLEETLKTAPTSTQSDSETPKDAAQEEDTIESLYGFKILTEEDWSRFKKYFDNVFPGLIHRLREIYPDITAAEQRLFMLIRLNSDSRETAEMLGISMESVRKTKYRLKKKLNLSEEEVLDDFVKKF